MSRGVINTLYYIKILFSTEKEIDETTLNVSPIRKKLHYSFQPLQTSIHSW